MPQSSTERDHQFEGAGYTQDHTHSLAIEHRTFAVASVIESLFGNRQPKQLTGIRALEVARRDAELHRVEVVRIEKTTAACV